MPAQTPGRPRKLATRFHARFPGTALGWRAQEFLLNETSVLTLSDLQAMIADPGFYGEAAPKIGSHGYALLYQVATGGTVPDEVLRVGRETAKATARVAAPRRRSYAARRPARLAKLAKELGTTPFDPEFEALFPADADSLTATTLANLIERSDIRTLADLRAALRHDPTRIEGACARYGRSWYLLCAVAFGPDSPEAQPLADAEVYALTRHERLRRLAAKLGTRPFDPAFEDLFPLGDHVATRLLGKLLRTTDVRTTADLRKLVKDQKALSRLAKRGSKGRELLREIAGQSMHGYQVE